MTIREEVIESLRKHFIEFTLLNGKKPYEQNWSKNPIKDKIPENKNFGILCGFGKSKVFVIDVDDITLLPYFEKLLEKTYVVKTGRGFHIYCKAKNILPKTSRLNNQKNQHIDIQSTGTTVVAETSIHQNGKKYEKISITRDIVELDFQEDFKAIFEELGFEMNKIPIKQVHSDAISYGLSEGSRNDGLFKLACRVLNDGTDIETSFDHISTINKRSSKPLSEKDIHTIVNSAEKAVKTNPKKYERDELKKELISFTKSIFREIIVSSSDRGKCYVLIEINGHLETIDLDSKKITSWIRTKFYKKYDKILQPELIENIITLVRDESIFENKIQSKRIKKRISSSENSVYYDLCNDNWELVKITNKVLEIVKHGNNTPIFLRSNNQSNVCKPIFEYDGNPIEEFCKLIRMDNDKIFPIHLVATFLEHIPTPIMNILGQEGSAKSIRSALIKKLVDPTGELLEEQLSHFGRNLDDFNIHFSNNYLVEYDNVSNITAELSDNLCKTVTGASYSKRQNYTDSDEITLSYMRKIGLNGISINIEHGDLARRSINYFTDRIPKDERKTVSDVLVDFNKIHAGLLGQIFVILQGAIKLLKEVQEDTFELPDMADFAIWGEAISRSMGFENGVFIKNYEDRLKEGADILNENNLALPFFEKEFEQNNVEEMVDSFGNWYRKIENYAKDEFFDKQSRNYPQSSNQIRPWIERSKPILYKEGFEIEISTNTKSKVFSKNAKILKIKKSKLKQGQTAFVENKNGL